LIASISESVALVSVFENSRLVVFNVIEAHLPRLREERRAIEQPPWMKEREGNRLVTAEKVSHPTFARYPKPQWKLTKDLAAKLNVEIKDFTFFFKLVQELFSKHKL
jgi:hypothetical protein